MMLNLVIMKKDILFGRVCELIFSPSVVAFRDAGVVPKVLDRLNVGALKCGDSLIIDGSNGFGLILK